MQLQRSKQVPLDDDSHVRL